MTGFIPPTRGLLVPKGESPLSGLAFHFNPTNLTIMKRPGWQVVPSRNDKDDKANTEWVGSSPATLKMRLLFDAVDDFGLPRSVSDAIDKLREWTAPTRSSLQARRPQPTTLQLFWGAAATSYFPPCRIKLITVRYTKFDRDGSPLRASVDLQLAEVADRLGSQNPTSGGIVGRRSVTVDAGDSLAAIAHREYGDPNMWRALAEANGIDDPMRVKPGTTLMVPGSADAERLVKGSDAERLVRGSGA
jgi:hypothetical protein